MITKTKKDVAQEFLDGLGRMHGEEFRELLFRELGGDLVLFVEQYAESIAARWSPGLSKEATTLIIIGYLLRAHEERWKSGDKPFFPA